MTRFADYYQILSHLSRTLNGAFTTSERFLQEIRWGPEKILPLAAKLRNATLFRECIIWVVSEWPENKVYAIEDPKVKKIAQNAFNSIAAKAAFTQHELLDKVDQASIGESETVKAIKENSRKWLAADPYLKMVPLPALLTDIRQRRQLEQYEGYEDYEEPLRLGDLQKDNCVLVRNCCHPGEGELQDRFLCAEVDDNDLPWDAEETYF